MIENKLKYNKYCYGRKRVVERKWVGDDKALNLRSVFCD